MMYKRISFEEWLTQISEGIEDIICSDGPGKLGG